MKPIFPRPAPPPFALKHLRPSLLTKLASPEPFIHIGAVASAKLIAHVDTGCERHRMRSSAAHTDSKLNIVKKIVVFIHGLSGIFLPSSQRFVGFHKQRFQIQSGSFFKHAP